MRIILAAWVAIFGVALTNILAFAAESIATGKKSKKDFAILLFTLIASILFEAAAFLVSVSP